MIIIKFKLWLLSKIQTIYDQIEINIFCLYRIPEMFRLGERIDPLEEKRQARENTITSVVAFCILCAAIRIGWYNIILSL